MKDKHQELEIRNIMQGLEEFATFMSYQSNSLGLRILSVESVDQDRERQLSEKAQVLAFKKQPNTRTERQRINRSLEFREAHVH